MSAEPSASTTETTALTTIPNTKRHATTAVDKQRNQLERLLKDPSKPAFVPAAPQPKEVRAPRDMMKNVQGSSAGAGSGEFHVYKASRRREYERLKIMEEESQKLVEDAEFERKRREVEELAEKKTSKNRAKRQKQKERARQGKAAAKEPTRDGNSQSDAPLKKRRLVNGKELVFRRPGESSDEEEEGPTPAAASTLDAASEDVPAPAPAQVSNVIIHEDD